jgi:hypothetical protein
MELGALGSGVGSVAGCCERGNELSGFVRDDKFLDHLNEHLLGRIILLR